MKKPAPILVAALISSSLLIPVSANHEGLDVRFKIDPDGAVPPCVITQPLIFDLGTISYEGKWAVDTDLVIQCESEDLRFFLLADSMSSGDHIYKDDYISVFAGANSNRSSDNTVRFNGLPNGARDACTWSSLTGETHAVNVGGEMIYPIGGNSASSWSSNSNSCILVENPSPTGEYVMQMRAIVMMNEMPTGDDLDNMPSQVVVPVTLIPWTPVE